MGKFSKPSVQRVAEQCMATPSCVASFNPTFYSGEILPWEKGTDCGCCVAWRGIPTWKSYFPSSTYNDALSSGGFIPRGKKV